MSEQLTQEEINFLLRVMACPGCKIDEFASHWEDDGTEYGKTVAHWKRPEELGIIEAVGSYKWVPTKRLGMCITIDGIPVTNKG